MVTIYLYLGNNGPFDHIVIKIFIDLRPLKNFWGQLVQIFSCIMFTPSMNISPSSPRYVDNYYSNT